jgi:hypothetical protein
MLENRLKVSAKKPEMTTAVARRMNLAVAYVGKERRLGNCIALADALEA